MESPFGSDSPFGSEKLQESAKFLSPHAKRLLLVFPEMEWNLKRAGYNMNAAEYMAVVLFLSLSALVGTLLLATTPVFLLSVKFNPYIAVGLPVVVALAVFFYFLMMPKAVVTKQSKLIDKDLEYMLKDMQIQMTAGVPLFNTLANIAAGGYGACSKLVNEIVQEVESGSSMRDVLNNYGILSPSEYMRRTLWQIANSMQTGSDIKIALAALSNDIRQEKENKIKIYGQELSLLGLIYMIVAIVLPSMGITLLVVLSSFLTGVAITIDVLWIALFAIAVFQMFFISIIRSRRPDVE